MQLHIAYPVRPTPSYLAARIAHTDLHLLRARKRCQQLLFSNPLFNHPRHIAPKFHCTASSAAFGSQRSPQARPFVHAAITSVEP